MKSFYFLILPLLFMSCSQPSDSSEKNSENPFFTDLNVPIDYANVTAADIEEYANHTFENLVADIESIRNQDSVNFTNVFVSIDDIYSTLNVASNNCFMLYWVSPDSLSRVKGLAGYQLLDSLSTSIFSDKALYTKMLEFRSSDSYNQLEGHRKILADDLILWFEQSGVNLKDEQLMKFKALRQEISQLSSEYSDNMNASDEEIILDEQEAEGLPENFKETYKNGDSGYKIPVINATRGPVMSNAKVEDTRKDFYLKYNNRAADKNLEILDKLVQNRYELAQIMGYNSYAEYYLYSKMARNPENVWSFLNDLVERSKAKAIADLEKLQNIKTEETGNEGNSVLQSWDIRYYNNQILKTQYQVDHEKIREFLSVEACLKGVLEIYENLFGLKFKKVKNPSVWHEDVDMYEVFEGEELVGRFYLDLFPRPNKESWFYGVGLNTGKAKKEGYEVPVVMLLGNFTSPTEALPSLLSHNELSILFHEFGHIIDGLSYTGEFALQATSKSDFVESMSQIIENWIWDYEMLSLFAKHYETGEVLPKEIFDNLLNAKNVSSGLNALRTLRSCIYDMNLYDSYNPEVPMDTDDLWEKIDQELGVRQTYVEGTHPQASWIHINTHPVYMYGYLWAEVYAQDMFTEFRKNGLLDRETGERYRRLILANGIQRDIMEVVEEFLGRPSNNEAYIRSLGLE